MKQFFSTLIAIAAMLLASSCSDTIDQYAADVAEPTDSIAEPSAADSVHTITMTLHSTMTGYNGAPSTRATSGDWAEGDALYLRFSTASGGVVTGSATYQAATASWALTYTGTLPEAAGRKAEVVHIDGVPLSASGAPEFDATHGVWLDQHGTYTMSGGSLSVTATLSPMTGRIRFRGTQGQSIALTNLQSIYKYDVSQGGDGYSGTFYSAYSPVTLTVNGTYTPYIYGWINENHLEVETTASGSTRQFGITFPASAQALAEGTSSWMYLPTEQRHDGWEMKGSDTQDDEVRTYNAKGVSFQMVKVSGGTFTMGATPEQGSDVDGDEKPAHSVTLSSYYIGKYEVTQQLWQAVMGSNPSTFKGNKRPVEMVSWEDCQTFISMLNTFTGAQFRLPTEAEWEFAARGGVKSQGYKYSGSNVIDDVAWYGDNSGNSTHDVGTKRPNELGLYDMSGNVDEWCSDWYGSYSSGSQTNPTGPDSGSSRVYCGGSWRDDARGCRSSRRSYLPPDEGSYFLGLRLVLVP